jgi:hypothetical protein
MDFDSGLTSGWQPIYQSTQPLAPSLATAWLTSSRRASGLKRKRVLSGDSENLVCGQGKDGHALLTQLGAVVEMEGERRPRFGPEWEYVIDGVRWGLKEVPGHDDLHFPERSVSGRETDEHGLDDVQNATV